MISLSGLSKTYAKSATKAVDSLSLEIGDGEIFGFLGPNGAGKTTTIKMLCGALSPDSGRVAVDGIDMAARPLEAKARLGMVGDNPELFNRLKASEYLNFVADVYRIPDDRRRERIGSLAERFEIADVLGSSIGGFSRGMKQKLCIVASLVHDPANWVLDEPMVGLDPQAAFSLKEIMRDRVRAGKCVFFSTHVMEVAERLCDRLAILSKGRVLFTGSLDALRDLRDRRDRGKETGRGAQKTLGDSGSESLESLFLEMVDGDGNGGE